MSDYKQDAIRDKIAEYKEQCHWARESYCYNQCDEHGNNSIITSIKCPYYDEEQEVWDYEECFRDKGW